MPKLEVQFKKSMTANKRNQDFAYLIRNVADVESPGLYPAADFQLQANDYDIDGRIAYYAEGILVTEDDGTYTFRELYIPGPGIAMFTWTDPITAFAYGSDGLYFVSNDKVYKADTSSADEIDDIADTNVRIGGFDGLYYWWIGDDITRLLPDGNTEVVFSTLPNASSIRFIDFYEDQMILYFSSEGTTIYFWDKQNTAFFDRRLVVKETLIAGAVVDGLPMLVTSDGRTYNPKEAPGHLNAYAYNGLKFIWLNAIKAPAASMSRPAGMVRGTSVVTTQEYMVFSVDYNSIVNTVETDIYQPFVYKLYTNGEIQVQTLATESISTPSSIGQPVTVLGLLNTALAYGVDGTSSTKSRFYTNLATNAVLTNYDNYTETQYITNFYTNPYNRHKLYAVSLSFELLYGTEELDIYYRTSVRESWELLVNITRDKVVTNTNLRIDQVGVTPTPMQRYQVTKMPNGDALPEFNEIQFKLHSKRGFSVIGMWFEYDYLTRETKR